MVFTESVMLTVAFHTCHHGVAHLLSLCVCLLTLPSISWIVALPPHTPSACNQTVAWLSVKCFISYAVIYCLITNILTIPQHKLTPSSHSVAHKCPPPHTLLPHTAVHSSTIPDLYASMHSHTHTDMHNSKAHKSRVTLGDKSDAWPTCLQADSSRGSWNSTATSSVPGDIQNLNISFCYKLASFLLLALKLLQQQHTGHLHPSGRWHIINRLLKHTFH